jgi:thermitase
MGKRKRFFTRTLAVRLASIALLIGIAFGGTGYGVSADSNGPPAPPPDRLLVKFKAGVSAERQAIHRQNGGKVIETISGLDVEVVEVASGRGSEAARAYAQDARLRYAEIDYRAAKVGSVNDGYFSWQWAMTKIQAPEAWSLTTGSASIPIAILDTGVDASHADMAGKVIANLNLTTSPTAGDIDGHGTHVAGIAAAATNNGIGVAGVGYNSSIINVKVLDDTGSGYYSWIADGIVKAADQGAKVINMSLGGTAASTVLEDAINYAWNKGVVVVAAAGNNGSSTPFYPASYINVIAVASTDPLDGLSSYSNRGDWVDVAAPGGSIWSTLPNNGYGYKSGTSMASPHVAGLASLLFTTASDTSGNGRLNDEVRGYIETKADNIGVAGIGYGRINAYKAVQASVSPVSAPGSITGSVKNAATGAALAGAAVKAGTWSATTDSSGNYSLTGVTAGTYTASAAATGYTTASQSVTVTSGQIAAASFALVKPLQSTFWVDSIIFSKTNGNLRIDVKVVNASGPVAAVQVAMSVAGPNSRTWSFNGQTNTTGMVSFVISKAPKGTYKATVTNLNDGVNLWDKTQGIISRTYSLK